MYKELLQLSNKKPSKSITQWTKTVNSYFSKGGIKMTNKLFKTDSMSVVTRDMYAKTTVRRRSLVRMVYLK